MPIDIPSAGVVFSVGVTGLEPQKLEHHPIETSVDELSRAAVELDTFCSQSTVSLLGVTGLVVCGFHASVRGHRCGRHILGGSLVDLNTASSKT